VTSTTSVNIDTRAHLSTPGKHSRREFLRRAGLLAGAGVAAPWALDLAGLMAATQVDALDGYKALVCVFLYGGNDSHDTYIPSDTTSYNAYSGFRGIYARPMNTLLPLNPLNGFNDGRAIAFTPQWPKLKAMFDNGNLAVLSNVGTLRQPITKAEYNTSSKRPPQLFSHDDQQSQWQSANPNVQSTGWGGRLGDLMLDDNGIDKLFTCITASGNAVFMTGETAFQYQIDSGGVVKLSTNFSANTALTGGLRQVMNLDGVGPIPNSYSAISKRALAASDRIDAALTAVGQPTVTFPNTGLGQQLKLVARLIAAGRNQLGIKRQVFFVSTGGFDTHEGMDTNRAPLLTGIDDAFDAFYRATMAVGAQDEVTTFTGSDFARTLTINNTGTDHAWGGHHIIMGGSVKGKNAYGKLPLIANNGIDDVGAGRLIPTTSVDQYASTLAKWMGVTDSELTTVLPFIGNFPTNDLGFMKAPPTPPPPPPATGVGALTSGAGATATAKRLLSR
jgi:uncharacterized protein (DUF1501 family)